MFAEVVLHHLLQTQQPVHHQLPEEVLVQYLEHLILIEAIALLDLLAVVDHTRLLDLLAVVEALALCQDRLVVAEVLVVVVEALVHQAEDAVKI